MISVPIPGESVAVRSTQDELRSSYDHAVQTGYDVDAIWHQVKEAIQQGRMAYPNNLSILLAEYKSFPSQGRKLMLSTNNFCDRREKAKAKQDKQLLTALPGQEKSLIESWNAYTDALSKHRVKVEEFLKALP